LAAFTSAASSCLRRRGHGKGSIPAHLGFRERSLAFQRSRFELRRARLQCRERFLSAFDLRSKLRQSTFGFLLTVRGLLRLRPGPVSVGNACHCLGIEFGETVLQRG
jgi:hypothetical protein